MIKQKTIKPYSNLIKPSPTSVLLRKLKFLTIFFCYSETGRRENLHADATGAKQPAGEGHQVVRLPLAHAEVLRRGEGGLVSAGQTESRDRHQRAFGYVEEVRRRKLQPICAGFLKPMLV